MSENDKPIEFLEEAKPYTSVSFGDCGNLLMASLADLVSSHLPRMGGDEMRTFYNHAIGWVALLYTSSEQGALLSMSRLDGKNLLDPTTGYPEGKALAEAVGEWALVERPERGES